MYYAICNLCPSGGEMGRHGFTISLHDKWKCLVAESGLTQTEVNKSIEFLGSDWLDECGYNQMYDPDNCGHLADRSKPSGPNAKPMYDPRTSIRVTLGEWGLEHITVPGNACGLDIERRSFSSILRGAALTPHNIDCWRQKQLLLVVFCWFAESIILASTASQPVREGR